MMMCSVTLTQTVRAQSTLLHKTINVKRKRNDAVGAPSFRSHMYITQAERWQATDIIGRHPTGRLPGLYSCY